MRVSNLGFGASSLGGVFHDIREAEGIEAVHTAVDNGINFIDVSPYYGHLKAEIVLGKALKEIPRDNTGTIRPNASRRVSMRVWSVLTSTSST